MSKSRVNLLSRSRIRKRTGVRRSAKTQASWRACWVTQAPLGSSATSEMHAAAAELDKEEHVEPLQRNGLDREEVDREHAVRLRVQELTPERPTRSLAGPRPVFLRSSRTVVAETAMPSPRSSPTMRWGPQRGFSRANHSTNS